MKNKNKNKNKNKKVVNIGNQASTVILPVSVRIISKNLNYAMLALATLMLFIFSVIHLNDPKKKKQKKNKNKKSSKILINSNKFFKKILKTCKNMIDFDGSCFVSSK